VVYDDDHYYLGGVIAELLRFEGLDVTVVTPEPLVSAWTVHTFEVRRVQRRLIELGVTRRTESVITGIGAGAVQVADVYTGATEDLACTSVVTVTGRLPHDDLLSGLLHHRAGGAITTVRAVGDCLAPGTIAAAVWSGRRAAEEFDEPTSSADVPFRREITELDAER
jgi:dimethylamine/trimethylamine dehydrogenase